MVKSRLVVLLAVLFAIALPQTRILLYDFEARNVDGSVIRLTTQVLRDALNGTYKYVVVDPHAGTYCYNVVAAAESAKAYGAGQVLVGNIMSLGGKQFLTYQLVDAASAAVVLADKIETPALDEFPVLADRIATSIVERKPYMETAEPEKMTEPEIEPRFRHPRKPYTGLFLTAGYLYHFKPRKHDPPYYFSTSLVNINLAVSFETQQMLALFQAGLMRGVHDENDITFSLLGNYVIGKGDFAPFFGGGIGITRFSYTEDDGRNEKNDGLSLSAGGGVLALRTYYFRLMVAGYADMTMASNDWDRQPGSKFTPGARVLFGVSSPSLGPDATVKIGPGCVGAVIGGFFLTGLIIALAS